MILVAVLCALLVQDQKTPDLFEELRGSDAVLRLSVFRDRGATLSGKIAAVFKGDALKAEEEIEVAVDHEPERAHLQAMAEKDQNAVVLLARGDKAWRVRVLLFGGPAPEVQASRVRLERVRTQDDALRKCLEIARAAPPEAALLLAGAVCEGVFAVRADPEILGLYESGLANAAKHLIPESEGVRKIVSAYHPKVVDVARKYSAVHPGLIAWFCGLGTEEQRKAIVAALVQCHDDLDVEIRNYLKRQAERAKTLKERDHPFEPEQTAEQMFGRSYWGEQTLVRMELGRILLPDEPPRSFRDEEARCGTIVPRAREYLKK